MTRETSREALKSIEPHISRMERHILDYLRAWGPSTCEQIEEGLDMRHQTVSSRITALSRKGLVVDSGMTGRNKSGRRAIRWSLPS